MTEIRSAKKYLGNSQFKQLCHMTSELYEIWIAWILWRFFNIGTAEDVACEVIDLQGSGQTFLEGAMGMAKFYIDYLRGRVIRKNAERGYYE